MSSDKLLKVNRKIRRKRVVSLTSLTNQKLTINYLYLWILKKKKVTGY